MMFFDKFAASLRKGFWKAFSEGVLRKIFGKLMIWEDVKGISKIQVNFQGTS